MRPALEKYYKLEAEYGKPFLIPEAQLEKLRPALSGSKRTTVNPYKNKELTPEQIKSIIELRDRGFTKSQVSKILRINYSLFLLTIQTKGIEFDGAYKKQYSATDVGGEIVITGSASELAKSLNVAPSMIYQRARSEHTKHIRGLLIEEVKE